MKYDFKTQDSRLKTWESLRSAGRSPWGAVRAKGLFKTSSLVVLLLLLLWSMGIASGIVAFAMQPPQISTVDPVPAQLQLGQKLYLEQCTTCHIGIPPAVFPTQTWSRILQDSEHYGKQIELPIDPTRLIMWNYLRFFSRPQVSGSVIPYRFGESRYFKALHPGVTLPEPTTVNSCVLCHPGAQEFNFRSLTPEWESSLKHLS